MLNSIQHKLNRVRPPRVNITYDLETKGAIEKKTLPFVLGIIAPLSGHSEQRPLLLHKHHLVSIEKDNFNMTLTSIKPRLKFNVPNTLEGDGELSVNLAFSHFSDFDPLGVIQNLPALSAIYRTRTDLCNFQGKLEGNDALRNILLTTLNTSLKSALFKVDADTSQQQVEMSPVVEKISEQNIIDIINTHISQIDKMLSLQLSHIIHHNDFQRLEATWRGLHFLVMNSDTDANLQIKLLDTTFEALHNDLDQTVEIEQSAIYSIFNAEQCSALIGDYQFGQAPNDTELLSKLSLVASAVHAPFISSAYLKPVESQSLEASLEISDLDEIFDSTQVAQWRAFQASECSRYVTLTLPRVMLRAPYQHNNNPTDGLSFDEDIRQPIDSTMILWGNPAYLLAQRIAHAFSLYGWTAAISGIKGGGLLEGLPTCMTSTDSGESRLNYLTERLFKEENKDTLIKLGLMAVCHCINNKLAFFGGNVVNKTKSYISSDSSTANARNSALLPCILVASRFALYVKAMMREKIGSFMTRANIENYLNTWISQYVLLDESASAQVKADYPLRQARINVSDAPGKKSTYRATLFLKPHFQLEELSTSIRIEVDLPF